ncbi:chemotaxis protein CheW [Amphritea balenae]|uniref:Chemotaxis protein CheW n=1 Tax=Amphritea balenae TaxID=452629 RepID=A0A3P1SLJ9_9GAMM|nr:chemotaxis protein CheW [Amphritea balenae]RRC97967.1 chemotaxis protein CheW [Amphritea balenae]GGK82151.1 chemotaxis protein CheW [Amphritea balenae]
MSLEAAAQQLQQIQAELKSESIAGVKQNNDSQEIFRQWATFSIADEQYAIDVMQVKEVLRFTDITPVPGAPDGVLGIINLRGNVVTVISSRSLFGMQSSEIDNNTRIVVVEFDEQETIGILVDGVSEVLTLPESETDRAPGVMRDDVTKQFVQGVCYREEQLIILLDLEKMLTRFKLVEDESN